LKNKSYEYLRSILAPKYTLLDLKALVLLLKQRRDIYVVTDVKHPGLLDAHGARWFWEKFVSIVGQVDHRVLQRIVPMLTRLGSYEALMQAWNWSIVGWDHGGWVGNDSMEIIKAHLDKIRFVVFSIELAMRQPDVTRVLRSWGVLVFACTVNDQSVMRRSRELLLSGYYTDTVIPSPELKGYFTGID
jgi:hypothetical protein